MEKEPNTFIKFKKKAIKGNIRKKEVDVTQKEHTEDADSSKEEEVAGEDAINLIKYQQNRRMKKFGLSHDDLLKSKKKESKSERSVEDKNIDNVISNQFSVDQGDGYTGESHLHEKVMEQYINSKLGLDNKVDSKAQKVELSAEDKLYKIPGSINTKLEKNPTDGITAPKGESDITGISSSWATGIAEVALPLSFKLKNIEATEAAKTSDRETRYERKESASGYYQRFQHHDNTKKALPSYLQNSISDKDGKSTDPNRNNDSNTVGLKRSQMSHDDISFDRYKKAQQKFRR